MKILALRSFKIDDNKIVKNVSGRANKTVKNLSKPKKSQNYKIRNLTNILNIRITKKFIFLNPSTKKVFNYLRQKFIKTPII